MGQFANTLFSILLGWVQTAVSWLWRLATSADVNAWMHWLLDNWLMLVLLLCIGGTLADFLVYLIRWQPYRVWRRFLQRLTGKAQDAPAQAEELPFVQRKWVFADGSTEVEELPRMQRDEPEDQLSAPIRPTRRAVRRELERQSYNQPVYPPQWHTVNQEKQGENE